MRQKEYFKDLKDLEGKKIYYSKLVYRTGDNEYFNVNKYWPLSSFYLKLMKGRTSFKNAKLLLREFNTETDRLKQKNCHTK